MEWTSRIWSTTAAIKAPQIQFAAIREPQLQCGAASRANVMP